jgi:hypothetical protein
MTPADRYAVLRQSALVREDGKLLDARDWSEHELQAHWFAGGFGRDFETTDGRRARLVQFGIWNHEAGPDFREAAVSFDGEQPMRGCIELDPDARDWERHGHATNPEYDAVILHVFLQRGEAEAFTRTSKHQLVPQVLLDARSIDDPPTPQPEAKPGRCLAPLKLLPEEKVREVLFAAAQYRLRRKSAALGRMEELHGPDEALFQALAATLGYKSNKLPFLLLAQRLPLKLLRAAKEDAPAMLFGVAGFLDQRDLADFDPATRVYLRELWERWWPRRGEFERLVIPRGLWNLGGQRPMNHPQRRLAALAQLVRHWPRVRGLRAACEPAAVADFCAELTDPYWNYHFTVTSKASVRPMALIGESRVTEMLANVFFPMAIATQPERWNCFRELRAPLSNKRVEIAALRLFGESPLGVALLKSVAMQQGLLQIYEDFCQRDATDCEQCAFPAQLAKW